MKNNTEITIIDVKNKEKHQRDSHEKQGKSSWNHQSKGKKGNQNEFSKIKQFIQESYEFRYNEVRLVSEFRERYMIEDSENETYKESEFTEVESRDENELYSTLKELGYRATKTDLTAIIESRSVAPNFNPFKSYFGSLPSWNGEIDYFAKLASYLTFESDSEKERFIRHLTKQFVRMVKQVLIKGYFNKQCFSISGNQNDGKTSLIRWFVPEYFEEIPKFIGTKYYTENLNPLSKDDLIALSQCFICNYDELATLSKQEIGILKNFFVKATINARHPYDRKPKDCKRNASFFGTTNEKQYLIDHTGSVRWLCFVIKKIDFVYSKEMNINQLYSQAYTLYKQGFDCELSKAEEKENEEINRRFLIDTDAMNFIKRYFEPANEQQHHEFFNATDISEYLQVKVNRKIASETIGKAMSSLGYERASKRVKGEPQWGYFISIRERLQEQLAPTETVNLQGFLNSFAPDKYLIVNLINEYNSKFSAKVEKETFINVVQQLNGNDKNVKYELQSNNTYLDITPF